MQVQSPTLTTLDRALTSTSKLQTSKNLISAKKEKPILQLQPQAPPPLQMQCQNKKFIPLDRTALKRYPQSVLNTFQWNCIENAPHKTVTITEGFPEGAVALLSKLLELRRLEIHARDILQASPLEDLLWLLSLTGHLSVYPVHLLCKKELLKRFLSDFQINVQALLYSFQNMPSHLPAMTDLFSTAWTCTSINLKGCPRRGNGQDRELFKILRERSGSFSRNLLGRCYLYGFLGAVQNFQEAAEIWRPFAEQGEKLNAFSFAGCLRHGLGAKGDLKKAIELYREAASAGLSDAQVHLGKCYESGIGVERNQHMAIKWYKRAAEQGHPLAMASLAYNLQYGKGIEYNPHRAEMLYGEAADIGLNLAKEGLERALCPRRSMASL